MTKDKARKEALEKRKNVNKALSSNEIINKIIESNILDGIDNIGIYYPIGKEIDIMELVNIYKNKTFYLPITKDEIDFIKYGNNTKLIDGPFKTKEPIGDIVDRNIIECFIIPCVAISSENKRVGYGKGYYDRYLAGYNGIKIGICYQNACDIDIDMDEFDVSLDYVFKG